MTPKSNPKNIEILKEIVNEKDPHHGEPEFNFFPDYVAAKLYERCFEVQKTVVQTKSGPQRFSLEKYVETRRKREVDT